MGREVRLVKEGWEHPMSNERDGYQQQSSGHYYKSAFEDYETERAEWQIKINPQAGETFKTWTGYDETGPDKKWYMPIWSDEEQTHMHMYEDTSEGTPISPVFRRDQADEMATWLFENNASTMGHFTTTKEAWLKMIEGGGYAVGMVISNGVMKSGVDAL